MTIYNVFSLINKGLHYQASNHEDTQSKILGAADDLLINENTDSISSVLRKE